MFTPEPLPTTGVDLPAATATEAASATTPAPAAPPFANRVCVVIAERPVAERDTETATERDTEAEVRRWLGEALPIRLTHWDQRAYLAVIRRLRPQVIVVLEATTDLAWQSGNLIACLFERFAPTIISATMPALVPALMPARLRSPLSGAGSASVPPSASTTHPRLIVHQLGFRAEATIAALDDLALL